MVGAGDDAERSDEEERRRWLAPATMQSAAMRRSGAAQMNQAFRNIVNMLHGVRDGLVRDANNYEQQEQASQQILSS